METFYVCNGNLVSQDSDIDSKEFFLIEESFESYENQNSNHDEPDNETDHQVSHKRTYREWSQYETKILLDMYRRNVTQVGPMKKFKSKREMFKAIAQTISTRLNITRSSYQCENRYKTVINQRKVGRTFLRKTMSNEEKKLNEEERSQNSVTASVSADHDYNGQNSEINGRCPIKSMNEWGVNDTKLLMELYKKNISKVGLERTFRTKSKMFEHIASVLSDVLNITRTAEQCHNRYKTIFRRKSFKQKRLSNNNSISANNTVMENNVNSNISSNCDTHFVTSKLDLCDTEFNTDMFYNKPLKKEGRHPKLIPKSLPNTSDICEETLLTRTLKEIAAEKEKTLLQIAENQERAEERRHQETMALIRQLGETIVQCIGNQPGDLTEEHY